MSPLAGGRNRFALPRQARSSTLFEPELHILVEFGYEISAVRPGPPVSAAEFGIHVPDTAGAAATDLVGVSLSHHLPLFT